MLNLKDRIVKIVFVLLACLLAQQSFAQSIMVRVQNNGDLQFQPVTVKVYDTTSQSPVFTILFNADSAVRVPLMQYPCIVEVETPEYEPLIKTIMPGSKQKELVYFPVHKKHSLKGLVVTGIIKPTKAQDALSLYKIIDAKQISAMGAVTLADALPYQLNMSVTNDAILGAGIRMQGLSGDKVKILMDGMPVNGRENGNIDLSQINLYNADRVEIVQGPMSVVYGSDALGGVINIISKDHFKKDEISLNTYYQSVGKYNINLNAAKAFGKRHSMSVGAGRNYFDGSRNIDTGAVKRQQYFKPKEQYFGNLAYSYNAPSGFRIRFNTDYLQEKVINKGPAVISPYSGIGYDDYYRTKRSVNRLSLSGKLGANADWQSMNSYSQYNHKKNSYQKDLVTLVQNLTTDAGAQDSSVFGEWNSRSSYRQRLGTWELTAGYDLDVQRANSQRISTGIKTTEDIAGFGLLSKNFLNKKLKMELGGRKSYNSLFVTPVLYSLNILYQPSVDWQVRGSYARGYRAPSLKEMYLTFFDQNHNITGSDTIKPESGRHVQVSVSHQFYQNGDNYLQLVGAGYYNDVKNEIVLINRYPQDSNSTTYYYGNLRREQNMIFNILLEGQNKNFHFSVGMSLNHTLAQTGSYKSFNAMEANASMQYHIASLKTNCNLFYKYTGSQPFISADISGLATYNGTAPHYQMLDVTAERKFYHKHIQLTAGIKNVLNVTQLTPKGFVQSNVHSGTGSLNFMGRNIFTSLAFNF